MPRSTRSTGKPSCRKKWPQTLAELAEQNTRLVAAVELLRKRTRLLMGAVLVLAVALGALGFNAA